MDRVGLSDPALVYHSFRHGFRDACRSADISEEAAHALGGWATVNQGQRYGNRGAVPSSTVRSKGWPMAHSALVRRC